MKIRLNEIPEEGREYIFDRKSAELNSVLSDLIADNAHRIDLNIRPLNTKDFTVNGRISTKSKCQCSRCAEEFDLKIEKMVREILIPNQEQDRTGRYARSNSVTSEDTSISVTEYDKLQFDLGEFLHEAIALEIPFNPYCEDCLKPENNKAFIYDEKMGEEVKPSPFQALKGIKIN